MAVRLHYLSTFVFTANARRWANAGLMLVQRLQRWPNIKPALAENSVFSKLLPMAGHFSCWMVLHSNSDSIYAYNTLWKQTLSWKTLPLNLFMSSTTPVSVQKQEGKMNVIFLDKKLTYTDFCLSFSWCIIPAKWIIIVWKSLELWHF